MDYTSLKNLLCAYMPMDPANARFLVALPQMIIDAENRIYRDCDFLATRSTQVVAVTPATRTVAIPTFTDNGQTVSFKVIERVNVITPAATAPDAGTRIPLKRTSRDFIDFVWPTAATSTGTPEWFSLTDDDLIVLAPTPNAAFNLEIIGTFRPFSLGASAGSPTTTYLSNNYPDLLFNATMVEASAYMKNFGAQADTPQMALSWETKYRDTLTSATNEAFRQKGEGAAWTPFKQPPEAMPART